MRYSFTSMSNPTTYSAAYMVFVMAFMIPFKGSVRSSPTTTGFGGCRTGFGGAGLGAGGRADLTGAAAGLEGAAATGAAALA